MSTLTVAPTSSEIRKNPARMLAVLAGFVMALIFVFGSVAPAFAADNEASSQAQQKLTTYVQSNMAGKQYEAEGGGSVKGDQLFQKNPQTNVYELNDYAYGKLSKKGQNQFAEDVVNNTTKARDESERTNSSATSGITDETVAGYIQNMQENPGFATKSMQTVLADIQPDYIRANTLISPWKPAFNTVLAVLIIVTFLAVLLSWVMDIMFITVPMMQNWINEGDGEGAARKLAGGWVSAPAKAAVEEAQNSGKSPLMGYMKRAFVQAFLMAIVLVLLVSGKMFIVGAMVVDLLSGLVAGK